MKTITALILWTVFLPVTAKAQIPVEVFANPENTSLDVMFFKFFQSKDKEESQWLFFNRNRVVVDYQMTDTMNLPFFASVNAVSYNNKKLKGFAPVVVGQLLNRGVSAKAGIQFARVRSNFTVFTWFVSEVAKNPNLDYYVLVRYKPRLNKKWNGFLQGESLNVFPTQSANLQLYQRARVGLDRASWQFGIGVDSNQIGRAEDFNTSIHAGVFLRHEFK